MAMVHEQLPEGESTANWFCQKGNFWGTISQLLVCARCGEYEVKRPNEPSHYRDVFKPTFHFVCNPCHDELPQ